MIKQFDSEVGKHFYFKL